MPQARILLGVIGRPHGLHGLVRVVSYADPPEAIAAHGPLCDDEGRRFELRWQGDGIVEVAEIVDGKAARIADRGAAGRLVNRRLFVARDSLPEPHADEFYLADLLGLAVTDGTGAALGSVVAVHDYGAGASLEIGGNGAAALLVPFTRAAVPVVDLGVGRITVAPPEPTDVLPR